MNPFVHELDRVEEDLQPYARTALARGRRFLAAYLPALFTALWTAHSSLTPGLIMSTDASVVVAILGELDPSIPWSTIVQMLDRRRHSEPVLPPGKGAGT
ncbi:MAG TPA: hypothetical protein VGS97_26155 [Actinocrinis sp.]|uniref:hypothetical protein n=1 Tax=Actinocrinis sp. TaxID=1920516 RepID=UPI002DDD10B3|nr:hypothetical protein [Actinocrinis sp.]HEV2347602.1 hypothetical protein [Actinocrinis sp.]